MTLIPTPNLTRTNLKRNPRPQDNQFERFLKTELRRADVDAVGTGATLNCVLLPYTHDRSARFPTSAPPLQCNSLSLSLSFTHTHTHTHTTSGWTNHFLRICNILQRVECISNTIRKVSERRSEKMGMIYVDMTNIEKILLKN